MSDEAALLRAVLQLPHADPPRLDYAHWLEQTGVPANRARGEFIRVQIALESSEEEDLNWPELARRERDLLETWGPIWEKPFRDLLKPSFLRTGRWLKAHLFGQGGTWRFHRGFIEEIDTSAKAFLDEDRALFGHAPIRRVVLSNATSLLAPLVADPRLDDLFSLHLIADVEFDEEMDGLSRAAAEVGLVVLELRFPRIQSDAGDLLALLRGTSDEDANNNERLEEFRNWARASRRERERLRQIASHPRLVQRLTEQEQFSHAESLRLNDWIYLGDRLGEAGAWAVVKTYHDLEDEEGLCRRLVLFKKDHIRAEGFQQLSESPHVFREATV